MGRNRKRKKDSEKGWNRVRETISGGTYRWFQMGWKRDREMDSDGLEKDRDSYGLGKGTGRWIPELAYRSLKSLNRS